MRIFGLFLVLFFGLAVPVLAQEDELVRAIQSVPENATDTDATHTSGEITPPTENPDLNLKGEKSRRFEDAPLLRLRILDKVRAESRTYELNVGRTVAYGNLRIRPRACRKSSPLDDPESAAFLQIWEVKPDQSSTWVFSGWMFASSPSISSMDHPVYDVTVLECKSPASVKAGEKTQDDQPDGESAESTNETPEAPSADDSSD